MELYFLYYIFFVLNVHTDRKYILQSSPAAQHLWEKAEKHLQKRCS